MLAAVLIIQLVAPLVLGIPIWIWADISPTARKLSRSRRDRTTSNAADTLVPLKCGNCSAPVPLHREAFPCPSCGATVTPPAEYVRMFDLRRTAIAELAKAERTWRWSRWTSSVLVTVPLGLASLGWCVLVIYALIEKGWGIGIDIVVLMTMGFLTIAGFVSAFSLAGSRKTLPPLPDRDFMHPPAASAGCKHCSAPIAFAAGQFAAICPYCGGDNYREQLVRAARADASAQEEAASDSLLDAVRELQNRRDGLFAIIGCAAIVELLYAALALYGMCSDALGC